MEECNDCRGEYLAGTEVPFRGCEADPEDPETEGLFKGEPACPHCLGLL